MIVTCAFREPYLTHNAKQLERLNGHQVMVFRDCLPYGEGLVKTDVVERFQKSLYGFKPHAVMRAILAGAKKVIWMDPSVYPMEDVQTIYDQLEGKDMLIIPGEHHINEMTNDKAFEYFGIRPDVNHIGGTIYAFNLESVKTRQCLQYWMKAELFGIFGDQDAFMAGHWADESCMALSMAKAGIEQVPLKFEYKNQKDGNV